MAFTKADVGRALMAKDVPSLVSGLAWIGDAGEGPALDMGYTDAVAKFMSHTDSKVVVAALGALGSMGMAGETFADAIKVYLSNSEPTVRAAAAKALGSLGSASMEFASDLATVAAEDSMASVKVAAITALGNIGAESAEGALKTALKDSKVEVSCAAAEALGKMCLLTDGAALIKMLEKPGPSRYSALAAIASMGIEAPMECLEAVVTSGLGDKDGILRKMAVSIIAEFAEIAILDPVFSKIKGLLSSNEVGVRAAAAVAFAAMGEAAAPQSFALLPLLEDAAEDKGGPEMALVMGTGAKRPAPTYRLPKCGAIYALGCMKVASNLDKIVDCLNDTNWEVRLCALEAIASFGSSASVLAEEVGALLEDTAFPVRAAAATTLGSIGAAGSVEKLAEALKDKAHSVRLAALLAMIDIGEPSCDYSHQVFGLIKDKAPPVRQAAVRCLSFMGETGQNYAGVVALLLNDEDAEMRAEVVEALGRMGPAGAGFAEDVAEKLYDPTAMVVEAAGRSLMEMGPAGRKYLYATEDYIVSEGASEGRTLPPAKVSKAYLSDLEKERAKLGC